MEFLGKQGALIQQCLVRNTWRFRICLGDFGWLGFLGVQAWVQGLGFRICLGISGRWDFQGCRPGCEFVCRWDPSSKILNARTPASQTIGRIQKVDPLMVPREYPQQSRAPNQATFQILPGVWVVRNLAYATDMDKSLQVSPYRDDQLHRDDDCNDLPLCVVYFSSQQYTYIYMYIYIYHTKIQYILCYHSSIYHIKVC